MIKLVINNSYSKLEGLSALQEKELRNTLSYTVGGSAAFFSSYGPRKKSLLSKRGEFPTGLLHRVLNDLNIGIIEDNRIIPKKKSKFIFEFPSAYKWQRDALKAAIKNGRGIISAPTGTGKSRVISMISEYLGLRILVIVPSLEIKRQLNHTLSNLSNITIENIDSTALKALTEYDCLIIDEAHHVAAKTYQKLNKTSWINIAYRFFITATPFRNDTEETLLFESIAGQVIYQLDYRTAIKENYIVPVEGYYIEITKQNTDAFTYNQVYKELVIDNTPRNLAICGLLTTLHTSSKSTLCLVKEVRHGQLLSDMTGLPFVSGEDDESRKFIGHFNSGQLKVLIATTGIMGEGIDSKPCEYVVIAGLGKAKSQFMQQIGRAVRKYEDKDSAKVILIKDRSHKFTIRHFNAQKTILKDEYDVICHKLEV